ncbi:Holliday junction branch migration protein RuvA [Patescibacteria group bacterium]|nr:Holliday junction branch migration protein RuvA [Patescibacteria group bacterium]
MIGSLRGKIIEVHASHALLETNGVGYKIRASIPALASFLVGQDKFLYIHDNVREDARNLFAFESHQELVMFEKLISISGVGPKAALTIMSVGTLETVRTAVMSGDLATLTSVPGIGKKTAQKIILELKGQLVEEQKEPTGDREVVDALVSLGYSSSQARDAMKEIDSSITDVSERIRQALRSLS